VAVGKVVYTPVLDPKGGFKSDLTVMRLGDEHFRVVTGGAHGMADRKWFTDQLVDGASLVDRTDEVSTIGLWGPRARDILASLTDADVSDGGFGFLTCRSIEVGSVEVLASRISYVGELGWELYVDMEHAAELWETLLTAGEQHGAVPVGIGVYGTTGRIEKAYRAFGYELDGERSIVEAGMQRPRVKAADFIGREAYLAQRDADPQTVLCTMTVDDHTSASGVKRYMLGGEPILTRDGGTLTDGHGHHPYVTSAGSAPSLGKHLLMAYLPPDVVSVGTELAVSYMEELYPVTVVSADATPPFDPANERIR
jgi:glycine cleavage system aminomethyltransferase T